MTLGDIDYSLELPLPEMWLAKSDRTIVAKLDDRAGIGFSRFGHRTKFLKHTQLYKLNSISELEFSVSFQVEINHELVRNAVVDLINESSLIKSIHNGFEEWFTIIDISKTMDADKDALTIQCRSLGYELIRRYVRNFKVVSQNLSSLCLGGMTVDSSGNTVSYNGLLNGTLWGLASDTDATFDTIFRSIDISKASILDALVQICKTFNAIMVFDTINRKIGFQQLQNIGQDKGGKISYNLYMKSLENESKTDLLVTRFVPYGKNGLTINAITGNSHIDDFSFFTNGFTRDTNKVVLTHSPHMSDSLCGAILDYISLQQAHSTDFSNLLTSLTNYQETLTQQKKDLIALNTTIVQIQNQIDIKQTTGQNASVELAQQSSQQALITAKQNDINTTNANITSTNNSIASLQNILSTNNNFTQAQQQELIPFIREAEWTDNNITDPQDLYNQALIQFTKYKTPQIILKVDMTNIFEEITEQRVWDKFWVGNDILVEYDVLGTSVKSKIVEMSFDHAEGNLAITIASVADLLRQEEQVWNMLYQSVSSANILSVNIDNWGQIDTVAKNVNALYNEGIDAAKLKINGGADNTIIINNRGLTSTVSSDPNSLIRLNNGVLGFSSNSGSTFNVAISAQGIFANKLTGQILIGANLLIANQAGTFSVDGNGVTMVNSGLTITNTTGGNGISMSAANGLIITRSDNKFRSVFNGTSGIQLQTSANSGATWNNVLSTDTVGNLTVNNLTANSITVNNSNFNNGAIVGSSINVNNGTFSVSSSGAMVATSATIYGIINAYGGTFSGNITASGTITGGTISGATINGGTINVQSNVNVGDQIYMNGGGARQSITSPGNASVEFTSNTLTLSAASQVVISAGYFSYQSSEVATKQWVLAQGYSTYTPPPA
jgi:hypothetical protein